MIVTITPNLALDVTYEVTELRPGETNRVDAVHARAGGKGVNVARVLRSLGHDVLVLGLAGGPTGDAVRMELEASGLAHDLVPSAGETTSFGAAVIARGKSRKKASIASPNRTIGRPSQAFTSSCTSMPTAITGP